MIAVYTVACTYISLHSPLDQQLIQQDFVTRIWMLMDISASEWLWCFLLACILGTNARMG